MGGYFGGRLAQAGEDVTFLVRPRRLAKLSKTGLIIKSKRGNISLFPHLTLSSDIKHPYDLIILACKAYDLEAAIESLSKAVGPETYVLPLLNGVNHLEVLDKHFGQEKILGGTCYINTKMNKQGEIIHVGDLQKIAFGERFANVYPRCHRIAEVFDNARIDYSLSGNILQDMWEKYTFFAAASSINILMRASIGTIAKAPEGAKFASLLYEECLNVATHAGFPTHAESKYQFHSWLVDEKSLLKASMLKDIMAKRLVESDHIQGYMIQLAEKYGLETPLLRLAFCHLKCYESEIKESYVKT